MLHVERVLEDPSPLRECLIELAILLLLTWSPKIMNQTPEKSQNPAIFYLHVGSCNTPDSVCSLHSVQLALPCQDHSTWAVEWSWT